MFDQTFYHFFFGFVIIIGLAFGILIVTDYRDGQALPEPVDNLAVPQ